MRQKLNAFDSSTPGDAILNSGSDSTSCASEIAPESTTVLKKNSNPMITPTAPMFASPLYYRMTMSVI
jgi:hypothetical protein